MASGAGETCPGRCRVGEPGIFESGEFVLPLFRLDLDLFGRVCDWPLLEPPLGDGLLGVVEL